MRAWPGYISSVSSLACSLIWLLAFAILSPITFSLTIGPYYFGTFGYDARRGKCEVINCQPAQAEKSKAVV